jgi:hypothetical protein
MLPMLPPRLLLLLLLLLLLCQGTTTNGRSMLPFMTASHLLHKK